MTRTYEQLIPRAEREKLELALEMGQGYVLDLSDRTFNDFFYERLGIDPETEGRLFNGRGTSKAKRLRSFIERAPASLIAKLLRELWNYRSSIATRATTPADQVLEASYFITVGRFEGVSQDIDSSVIESFEPSETLDELVASIRRDLDAKKPHAALDRLHTYCMKRFASLVRKHGGGEWAGSVADGENVQAYREDRACSQLRLALLHSLPPRLQSVELAKIGHDANENASSPTEGEQARHTDDRTEQTPSVWKSDVALAESGIAFEDVVVAIAHRRDNVPDIQGNCPNKSLREVQNR